MTFRPPEFLLPLAATFGLLVGLQPVFATPAAEIDHGRLWEAYASRFLSGDGRIIDPQGGDRTTSEGQSYAMFFALVNNDRARFARLLTWTESNLASGDLGSHLPAWSWGHAKDGHWGTLDPNSASDSDLWIAYDLIEAGRLWKEARYTALGRKLAAIIARQEVARLPGLGPMLLPGASGFRYQQVWVLNPSYLPLFVLNRLAVTDPSGPWAGIARGVPEFLARSSVNGFAMDWVCYSKQAAFSPCQSDGKKAPPPVGSYDAIRVYLWAGLVSDADPGKAQILRGLAGMSRHLAQQAAPPEQVNQDGIPLRGAGPVGFSAALLPYLQGSENYSAFAQQLVRVKSQLDEKSNLFGSGSGRGPTYYDQNLVLFASGWMEKKFQFGSNGELLVRWSR